MNIIQKNKDSELASFCFWWVLSLVTFRKSNTVENKKIEAKDNLKSGKHIM